MLYVMGDEKESGLEVAIGEVSEWIVRLRNS
jgi:hypothetical protein